MIGKMYRPLRITKRNRGFSFSHKYNSNLRGRGKGGEQTFEQVIQLTLVDSTKSSDLESILVEFENLSIPLLIDETVFEKTAKRKAKSKNSPFEIVNENKRLIQNRKLERPGIFAETTKDHPFKEHKEAEYDEEKGKWYLRLDMTSKGSSLSFEVPIHPTSEGEGIDWLIIELQPIVVNGEEYMELKATAKTQILVTSNTEIELWENVK